MGTVEDIKPYFPAKSILMMGEEAMVDRAAQRDDDKSSERSMAACVEAFNAIYGTHMTETQGWMFMVFLKAARARQGDFQVDDFIDGAAYFALAGESASKENNTF